MNLTVSGQYSWNLSETALEMATAGLSASCRSSFVTVRLSSRTKTAVRFSQIAANGRLPGLESVSLRVMHPEPEAVKQTRARSETILFIFSLNVVEAQRQAKRSPCRHLAQGRIPDCAVLRAVGSPPLAACLPYLKSLENTTRIAPAGAGPGGGGTPPPPGEPPPCRRG